MDWSNKTLTLNSWCIRPKITDSSCAKCLLFFYFCNISYTNRHSFQIIFLSVFAYSFSWQNWIQIRPSRKKKQIRIRSPKKLVSDPTKFWFRILIRPHFKNWIRIRTSAHWEIHQNLTKLCALFFAATAALRTTRGSPTVCPSVRPSLLAFLPFTQKLFRQPIPQNLWPYAIFFCGCPYEKKKLKN